MKNIFLIIFITILFFPESKAQDDNEINNNEKFEIIKINDNYSYCYDKTDKSQNKKFGLLKNGKIALPLVFSGHDFDNKNKLELSFKGLKGLYNLESGKWDIPLKYESLSLIQANTYEAQLNGKYGIVDDQNNIIVNFQWLYLSKLDYGDNYYRAISDETPGKYGLFNIVSKKLTIPCEYSSIEKAGDLNFFTVKKDGKYNIVDINNKPLFKNWYDNLYIPSGGKKNFIVTLNNKMGIIDRNENLVVPIEYINIESTPYKDGSYLAQDKTGKFGCISLDGRITLPFKYSNIEKVDYGSTNIIAKTQDKCGIVRINDGMPYEIATCDYNNISSENEIFIVEKDNKFGMLDQFGDKITEIIYDKIEGILKSGSYRSNSKLYVANKDGNYFLLNKSGKNISSSQFKLVSPFQSTNEYGSYSTDDLYIKVKGVDGKFGLVDEFAKEVVPQIFDDIISRKDNYVIVKEKNKTGIYHVLKNELVLPVIYDQIFVSKSGFIAKKENEFYKIELGSQINVQKMNFEY
jgi:hypothetical protein